MEKKKVLMIYACYEPTRKPSLYLDLGEVEVDASLSLEEAGKQESEKVEAKYTKMGFGRFAVCSVYAITESVELPYSLPSNYGLREARRDAR